MTSREVDVDSVNELLSQATVLLSRHLLDRTGLSPTASAVLYRLHAEGPVRLTALASSVEVSQPSMTQLIQRLERKGLVARLTDPIDRRAALVTVTDGGRQLVLDRQDGVRERLGELLMMLSQHQRDALDLAARVALPVINILIDVEAAQAPTPG
ncbi:MULTISPECIES: MarR family transcriptional regulator [unclassified Mycobacterium]|uniref:MarR family winged helix-turn-helix transcriptional regulator n=1 Tax=unclassified Mycobacterium TaxID=2642494 RepID=UPI0029C69099|nr:MULTISPECIES: MarR family transcriptional regulator [unclassified Mycobacterium]